MTQNIVDVEYECTGNSTKNNELGMRPMQAKAYEARNSQYILLKAPPAAGKSRALMFIALDKLVNQGLKKVIVAVPEKAIGGSFEKTDLKSFGFFADWDFDDKYNLCTPGDEKSKIEAFKTFMNGDEKILVCTHATLRFAFEQLDEEKFNNVLVAIDEFHHASEDGNNKLGGVVSVLMDKTDAHIMAMTGSYFRGDAVPIMSPEDEEKFEKVSYNYYEQLNGYEHLKTLGIGYHFYQGGYTSKDAIGEILDTNKKTIVYIPHRLASESMQDKYKETNSIIDLIGEIKETNDSGIMFVERYADKKIIKVADLVNDDEKEREKTVNYLRSIKSVDDLDLIISLGMAKEGFDWPYCEHVLTVGYRHSLTEVIQIIGRATRDSDNKTHAQSTNLVAKPDAENDEVTVSVNNMLKAITASLLMEQVLAPNFTFKPRFDNDKEPAKPGEVKIKGFKLPTSERVKDIIKSDLNDLKAKILQDKDIVKTIDGGVDANLVNKNLIPKIIKEKYPDLDNEQVDELRQHVVADSVMTNAETKTENGKQFIKMAHKFVNIDKLSIDLIDTINPFQRAYEILSKSVDAPTLKLIQSSIESTRIKMSEAEAVFLYNKVVDFKKEKERMPDVDSVNPAEKRMAEAIVYLTNLKRNKENG